MRESRPFVHLKEAGVEEFPVPALIPRSEFEANDWLAWHPTPSPRQAPEEVREKREYRVTDGMVRSLSGLHSASRRGSAPRFSASHGQTVPPPSIDLPSFFPASPAQMISSARQEVRQSTFPLPGPRFVETRSVSSSLSWPDVGRIAQLELRATGADAGRRASQACAKPSSTLCNLLVLSNARMEKVRDC
jgi:hypothetical protein